MKYYATQCEGVGGRLRVHAEDFVVEEITKEGLVANETMVTLSRGEGGHSLAVLTKISRDTMPTCRLIGRALDAKVSFAGIKDRRAKTSQLISINRPLGAGELSLGIPRASVRVVGRSKWPLEPGELRGNRFTIILRQLKRTVPEDLRVDLLPGYFGHQRFGTTRPNTHKIGRSLVKKDLEGAVRELLAEPYPNEPGHVAEARAILRASWDVEAALRSFPCSLSYERAVLARLLKAPGDWLGALRALPWGMICLYANAYQSYLFNLALSRRWEQDGLDCLKEGDFASPLDRWGSPSRPMKVSACNAADLRRMVSTGRGVRMMRVLGARTELEGGDRDAYSEIMENEGVTQNDFEKVVGRPFYGTLRFSTFRPLDLSTSPPSPDDLHPGAEMQTITTTLPKGCYATVLLREIMRPADPFAAGF